MNALEWNEVKMPCPDRLHHHHQPDSINQSISQSILSTPLCMYIIYILCLLSSREVFLYSFFFFVRRWTWRRKKEEGG